jgi:hypothetical protein
MPAFAKDIAQCLVDLKAHFAVCFDMPGKYYIVTLVAVNVICNP